MSKANRLAYLRTEECGLSVSLVFLSGLETGTKKRSYFLLRNPALIKKKGIYVAAALFHTFAVIGRAAQTNVGPFF